MSEIKTWRATGTVIGSTYIGEFTGTKEEAYDKAQDEAGVSFCHQCTDGCEDPEVQNITIEAIDDSESYQPDPFPFEPSIRKDERAKVLATLDAIINGDDTDTYAIGTVMDIRKLIAGDEA